MPIATPSDGIAESGIKKGELDVGAISATGGRLLQRQTLVSIVRNSVAIYLGNLPTISLIYIIPMLPIVLLHSILVASERTGLASIVQIFLSLVGMLIGAAMTVTISDLCIGLQPRVGRSYRRGFTNYGRLIGTYLLMALYVMGGMLLLVVPGSIFICWYMFTIVVVVLEQLGGKAALRRSRALGKGCYLRNFGIVLAAMIPVYAVMYLVAFVVGQLATVVTGIPPYRIMMGTAEILGSVFFSPFFSIVFILLYYDMRARKDGYGAVQLAEDLRI